MRFPATLAVVLSFGAIVAPTAHAAVTVSRAEVSGTQLRLEGRALANRTITVDGVSMGTSDGGGSFRIERSPYTRPADCTIDVNDGSATPTNARLTGCTVTSSPAAPTASSLSLAPTSVAGGSSSTGTVMLSAAAPSGGQSVALSSSNAPAAAVPASVTVPGGASSTTFTVTTSSVAASTSATITATAGGVSRSAVLSVTGSATTPPPPPPPPAAAPAVAGLSLSPTTIREGATSTGTVTLTAPAPSGGTVVALSSGNAFAASVPASVTVPAGAASATFTITGLATTSTSSSVITAGAGGAERTAVLTVQTNSPTLNNLSIVPLSVTGGSSSTGTVTLTAPATAGGVVVALASANTGVATVPASVTVPAGAETATFTVATSAVTASTSSLITATHGSAGRSFTLAVTPAATGPAVSAVTLSSTTVVGGTLVTGTVTLTGAAPPGGTPVVLTSDNTNAATVPPSVTVPAGATRATFPVQTRPVASASSSTIVAEAGGARRGATLTVTSQFQADNGSISLSRGGTGEGRVVSTPAGIDCTFTRTGTTGRCSNAFFPRGTRVRLEARPAASSSFAGWEFEVSCREAPNVTVQAGTAHICRPVFRLR